MFLFVPILLYANNFSNKIEGPICIGASARKETEAIAAPVAVAPPSARASVLVMTAVLQVLNQRARVMCTFQMLFSLQVKQTHSSQIFIYNFFFIMVWK